jgi:hypothetical protein
MASIAGPQLFQICQAWVKPVNSTVGAAGRCVVGDGVGVGVAVDNTVGVDVGRCPLVWISIGNAQQECSALMGINVSHDRPALLTFDS